MNDVLSVDPRTGQATEVVTQQTSATEVERYCQDALAAAPALDRLGRTGRAALLEALAGALEAHRDDIVHGQAAGGALVAHPAIRAVGFTGSVGGGRALLQIIEQRPDPIPFFGELSSLNPVVVTPAGRSRAGRRDRCRAGRLGHPWRRPVLHQARAGLRARRGRRRSARRGHGCRSTRARSAGPAHRGHREFLRARRSAKLDAGTALRTAAQGKPARGSGFEAVSLLLTTTAADLPVEATEECFGPLTVVARYNGTADLFAALDQLPSSLTTTVLRGDGETELPREVTERLRGRTGRLIYDGYPTGVAVGWAQHHGGPWPSTNSQHTSVGATAIRRFLRPVAWQNAPTDLLPAELADDHHDIPRRIDGVLVLPPHAETK